MYWYMTTTTSSQALLSDDTWAQIPRTHADRRAVGAALVVFVLFLTATIIGNTAGILVPHLTYESGSTTPAGARTHALTIRATVHNDSARSWRITGATINAPGAVHEIQTTSVNIPAHQTRTVVGIVHFANCASLPAATTSQTNVSHDIKLRVQRLLGVSTVTINGVSDDQLHAACVG